MDLTDRILVGCRNPIELTGSYSTQRCNLCQCKGVILLMYALVPSTFLDDKA